MEEVPFPTKEAPGDKFGIPGQNLSEPPVAASGFPVALAETPVTSGVVPAIQEAKPQAAPELKISNFKFQNEEIPEFISEKEFSLPDDTIFQPNDQTEDSNFRNENQFEISNLKPEIEQEQPLTYNAPSSKDETENPLSRFSNSKLADAIRSMPVKMLPITSEELEHFDDDKLDTAYENRLLRAGDNLYPIANAVKIAEELIGTPNHSSGFPGLSENSNGAATATAAAKAKPVFEIPNFDEEEISDELPVLPENPTPEELLVYAQKHPSVKRVLRAFRGKIVEVKKL